MNSQGRQKNALKILITNLQKYYDFFLSIENIQVENICKLTFYPKQ